MKFCLAVLVGVALVGALTEDADPSKAFEKRIQDYLKARKAAISHVPKLKDKAEPEEILASKQAQAAAIRAARPRAVQGDVFTPPIQAHFKRIIRSEMTGKSGKPAKEAAKQGNPESEGAVDVPVRVNATYPDSAPLSTVPATLLLRLPTLPKELDYRFVGRHLILHDVNAGIVVDFIPNAMPNE